MATTTTCPAPKRQRATRVSGFSARAELTQSLLKSVYHYDPDTGAFTCRLTGNDAIARNDGGYVVL